MYTELNITSFLDKAAGLPVADVRSPAEFAKAHMPGAINLPLFNDEERKQVGITYKKRGNRDAVKTGLKLVQPKLLEFVNTAHDIAKQYEILVYCWRGGLRSSSIAWLFDLAGIKTYVLKGGYKTYRQKVLQSFEKTFKLIVVGGKTGTGKTLILQKIAEAGQQVVDLEQIAHHKGSAFGRIGQQAQSSNEQFENDLASFFRNLDPEKPVWVEDESRKIGNNQLPSHLYEQIRNAHLIYLKLEKTHRIDRLVADYSDNNNEELEQAILRITKKLGGLNTKKAVESLSNGNYAETAGILLEYYDKTYEFGLSRRDPSRVHYYTLHQDTPEDEIQNIIGLAEKEIKF